MKKLFLALLILTAFYGCKDFIEEDLEDDTVKIIAPIDGLSTSNATVTFWWEKIEGALKYNIQVVSPSFEETQRIWADSTLTGNKFQLSLVPGNYQWRISALNGSSTSNYVTASFVIDSTLNVANQTIILLSPLDSMVSNQYTQLLKWSMLYNADEYRLRVANSSNVILTDQITTEVESSYEFSSDGYYTWSVRGQNSFSNTTYSSFVILLDTEKPEPPVLETPANNGTISTDSINFSWTRATDTGSKLYDSLYVFSDVDLTQEIWAKKINSITYKDSLDTGTYYWYLKTCDLAGNIGDASSTFKFTKN